MGLSFDEIDRLTLAEYSKLLIVYNYQNAIKQAHSRNIEIAIYASQGAKIKQPSDLYEIPLLDKHIDVMPIRTKEKALKLIERVLNKHEQCPPRLRSMSAL